MHSRALVTELVLNDVDWVVSPVAAAVRIVGRILVYRGNLRLRLLMPGIAIVHNHHHLSLTALSTTSEQVLVRDTTEDRWIMLGSCHLRVSHFIALATTPINRVFFLLKHLLVHLKRALVKNCGVGIPRIHQDQAPFLAIRQSIAYRACLEGSAQVRRVDHFLPLHLGSLLHIHMHSLLRLQKQGFFLEMCRLQLSDFLGAGLFDLACFEGDWAE